MVLPPVAVAVLVKPILVVLILERSVVHYMSEAAFIGLDGHVLELAFEYDVRNSVPGFMERSFA